MRRVTPAPATGMRRAWSMLRIVYDWPVFYLCLVVLGGFQLGWLVVACAIRHAVSEERSIRIGRHYVSLLYRCCFRVTRALGMLQVDATALDALDPDEAMIIAPNHPSVMDAPILISRLEKLNCIMKASVLENPLLGAGARLAGYISNDGPKRMLRLSVAELAAGGQLIIFPEGTRTLRGPVNDFKCGFAAMARMTRVPIQTVFIETDTPFLSKGWPVLRKPPRLPMRFTVRVGRRFEVGDDVNAFVAKLQRYFVDELADAALGDLWDAGPVDVPATAAGGRGEPFVHAPATRLAEPQGAAFTGRQGGLQR